MEAALDQDEPTKAIMDLLVSTVAGAANPLLQVGVTEALAMEVSVVKQQNAMRRLGTAAKALGNLRLASPH